MLTGAQVYTRHPSRGSALDSLPGVGGTVPALTTDMGLVRPLIPCALFALLAGCNGSIEFGVSLSPPDSGPADSGVLDPPDLGVRDTGVADVGPPPDAGMVVMCRDDYVWPWDRTADAYRTHFWDWVDAIPTTDLHK